MKSLKYCQSLILTVSLTISTAVPIFARTTDYPLFSDFRIDASDMTVSQEALPIQSYHRNDSGKFDAGEVSELECSLNHVTKDASFYIQPKYDGVWVSVDYLTDLDQNGVYELLNGGSVPAWAELIPQDTMLLPPADSTQGPSTQSVQTLSSGQTYILSSQTLQKHYLETVKTRTQENSKLYLGLTASSQSQSVPLCLVNLHYTSPKGEQQLQSYYLALHGQILPPTDVPLDSEHYKAIEYVLSKGYFVGTSDGAFLPDDLFTRAQLAQILWRMGGSLVSTGSSFPDVSPTDWYYDAVSWCSKNNIMTGLSPDRFAPNEPLSQQQLALILYEYARHTGANTRGRADLSAFADGGTVAPWAVRGMEWAVIHEIMPVYSDNTLRPETHVTRGQTAMVLYAYDTAFDLK